MDKTLLHDLVQSLKEAKTLARSKKPIQKKKGMNPLDAEAIVERSGGTPAERERGMKALTQRADGSEWPWPPKARE